MKFITKLFNLILLAFTFCFVTFAEWGVYNLTALPSGRTNTIGIVSRDTGEGNGCLEEISEFGVSQDNVAYFDTFSFLGTDVAESVKREPRYMIRGWFSWDWWQKGMKWADHVAEFVVGVVVPVFAPTYEASQLKTYFSEYRGSTTVYFYNNDTSQQRWGLDVVGLSSSMVDGCSNYLYYEETTYETGDGVIGVSVCSIFRVVNGEKHEAPLLRWHPQTGGFNDIIHTSDVRSAYNSILKINKYNSGAYNTWANKLLAKDSKGNYIVRPSVGALYFQFYLAIVFSIWFVYQNPIVFEPNADGTQTFRGGLHWRHRRNDKKEKKSKKK